MKAIIAEKNGIAKFIMPHDIKRFVEKGYTIRNAQHEPIENPMSLYQERVAHTGSTNL